jgi:hypothetical protein
MPDGVALSSINLIKGMVMPAYCSPPVEIHSEKPAEMAADRRHMLIELRKSIRDGQIYDPTFFQPEKLRKFFCLGRVSVTGKTDFWTMGTIAPYAPFYAEFGDPLLGGASVGLAFGPKALKFGDVTEVFGPPTVIDRAPFSGGPHGRPLENRTDVNGNLAAYYVFKDSGMEARIGFLTDSGGYIRQLGVSLR